MNAKVLKKLNNVMPDFVKGLGGRLIRNKLIKNEVFLKQYEELEELEKLDIVSREKLQFTKLKNILCYAYENTIYYNKVFNKVGFNPYEMKKVEEIKKIPMINKELIISNIEEFLSNEKLNYYNASTGGSTGKALEILLEKDSIYKEKAFIYHHWSKLGYDYKKSKIVTFRGLNFNGKIKKYNPLYNEIVLNPFLLSCDTVLKYKNIIEKFDADYIHGYQSAIYSFCKILKLKNVKLSNKIKGVFYISENIDEVKNKFIEEFLSCKSTAFYGHSERAVFAEQYGDKYIFNDAYGYTEVGNIDGINRIVCTGFLNKKMPLIRYLTDDEAIEFKEGYKINGHRQKEVLIGKNGEEVSIAAMEFHNEVFSKIRMFQFEQNEKGYFTFNIVEDDILTNSDMKIIEKAIKEKLSEAFDFSIKKVSKVKLSNRGKFSLIVQNLK